MKKTILAMVGIGVCLFAIRFAPFFPAYAQDAEYLAASRRFRTTSTATAFPVPICP